MNKKCVLESLKACREPEVFQVYVHILGILSGQHVFMGGLMDDMVFALRKSELVVQNTGQSDMHSPETSFVPCQVCLCLMHTQL